MATAIDDTPLETEEKFFQKFFSMAKKAVRKEQPDESREPIYLTPDDYQDMGESLKNAGEKLIAIAEHMRTAKCSKMLQKAKQLKNTWVPWIIEFSLASANDVEPAAYAERRGVPAPKEANRLRYLRSKERKARK